MGVSANPTPRYPPPNYPQVMRAFVEVRLHALMPWLAGAAGEVWDKVNVDIGGPGRTRTRNLAVMSGQL